MISSSLKTLTRVATKNFWRLRIINNNLIKPTYFKNIQISKRFYHNTPGQSINTKNFSEISDHKDENINSVSNTTIGTDGRAKNNQQEKTTNFNELPYNEKLKKVYQKYPYGNEGQPNKNEEHNQDPMSVMYSNLAKDEDLNAKDNHISDDDKNRKFSQQSLLQQMSETTYGMPASENNVINVSDKSRVTSKIQNQQNLSEQQNKMKKQFDQNNKDKDRNLNDNNSGNVFHKVNQDENEMDYQKPIQSQSQSQNYNQSNLSSNKMDKENNSYNINDNMGMKNNQNEKHGEHLKKKVTDTNVDLDLSTKSFQKKLEEYKQNNASDDNTEESSKSYSKNDYFLKDNNSEYNNYINNQPDSDFVEEDNLDNYNKTSNNYNKNQKSDFISNKNENMNQKTQSKSSSFSSEKDHEIESDVNESLEGHNVTGRDDTTIDKDEEPAKDHNMYHNKGHLFPNH